MSEGSSGPLMPMITVESVDDTRAFYVEKLGFEHRMGVVGKDGKLDFCNLVIGKAALMFTRAQAALPSADKGQSVELYISVDDVDAYHGTVEAKGLSVTDPLTDQWWGDRTFVVVDPNGYRVWFYSTVAEAVPPPGMTIV